MRLDELLTEVDVTYHKSDRDAVISPEQSTFNRRGRENTAKARELRMKMRGSVLGSGVEAIVFQSSRPQNQGTVTRWLRNQSKDANNNGPIQYVIRGQQLNNPFIPRVYNIKQIQRKNGVFEFAIQMEKLAMTLEQYFTKTDHLLERQLLEQLYQAEYVDELMNDGYTPENLESAVLMALSGEDSQHFTPMFKQAHDLAVKYNTSRFLDIHDENAMIRLTSVGPQIVLTDPIVGNVD